MVCKHVCLFTTLGETLARPFFLAHMHRHTSTERLSEGFKDGRRIESHAQSLLAFPLGPVLCPQG